MGEACSKHLYMRYTNISIGKRERNRTFWKAKRRREDNIKIDHKETGCDLDSVAQDRDQ
jgi:hypothetical protein